MFAIGYYTNSGEIGRLWLGKQISLLLYSNYDNMLIKLPLKQRTIENKFFKKKLKHQRYHADNFLNRNYVNNPVFRH